MKNLVTATLIVCCGFLATANSFAAKPAAKSVFKKNIYVVKDVFLPSANSFKATSSYNAAGAIVAALPRHHVLIEDNVGRFYITMAPRGWSPAMGKKIVLIKREAISAVGEEIDNTSPLNRVAWIDQVSRAKFHRTFNISDAATQVQVP